MNKNWILFLIPICLTIIAKSASGQTSQISKAVEGTERTQLNSNSFLADTTFIPVPTDSTYANLQTGWNKAPGQMPIYFFGLPPNSMPILMTPPVDEEMILPLGIVGQDVKSDSLKTPVPQDK